MPTYLPPSVTALDPPAPYTLGIDYAWDSAGNTVRRLAGSSIPSGATLLIEQQAELTASIVDALNNAAAQPLPSPTLRILATLDWATESPSIIDFSDLSWQTDLSSTLASDPRTATLTGPPALREALAALDPTTLPIIEIAQELSEDFALVLFEGLISGIEEHALPSGQVRVTATLDDTLAFLEPPHTALCDQRYGRVIITAPAPLPAPEPGGFTLTPGLDEIVEVRIPTAHQILRELFAELESPWFTDLSLGILDFPVPAFDARGLTPLEVMRDLARLAGGQVMAEGRLLLIREVGPASRADRATFIYPRVALHSVSDHNGLGQRDTAVQLYGHAENGAVPTLPSPPYLPDPSQPGYVRLGETEGLQPPLDPVRTATRPPDLIVTFTFNATLYDPATLLVEGAERLGPPTYYIDSGITWATIELALPWLVTDTTGEAPFTLDEDHNPRFLLTGQIIDALAATEGAPLGIPYPTVSRERLIGGELSGDPVTVLGDAHGYYRFTDVPLAIWRIAAIAPGYRENWEDSDPDNNLIRDLITEYADWLANEALGRFEKQPTPYHILVWARLQLSDPGISDLALSQVRVEVRALDTEPEDLRYAPAIRDERLTTERLAIRVGQILLWASAQAESAAALEAPPNPLLRPGDRIVLRDLDDPGEDTHFDCGSLKRHYSTDTPHHSDQLTAPSRALIARVLPRILDDPLETRIGTVTALTTNQFHQPLCDVEIEGRVEPDLGISPLFPTVLGPLRVGDIVQVAKWHPGATTKLVVARAAATFGAFRIAEVPID